MNNKIYELCVKAISDVDGIENPNTQNMYIPDCFRDRFAELIVQECVSIVANKPWGGGDFAIRDMKQLFGVQQ